MTCIYCGQEKLPTDRSVEHVIPQSFGHFGPQTPTLPSVCSKCNQFFANTIDSAFARESLEGIERYKKGIYSSEERPQQHIEIRLPRGLGDYSGAYAWINGMTGKLMPVRSQVRFTDNAGQHVFILKERFRGFDWKLVPSLAGFKVYADSLPELEKMIALLKDVGIIYDKSTMTPRAPSRPQSITVGIEGDNRLTGRAIVKILINLCAFYLGDEVRNPLWIQAKQFVLKGDRRLPGRMWDAPFWPGEKKSLRLPNTSYNLRLRNQDGNVVGSAQFFNLFLHEFILVENHAVSESVEKRFTNGQVPIDANRINYAIMMPHRLNFDLTKFSDPAS